MDFVEIRENKKKYLDLLLLADEQESMIDFISENYKDNFSVLQVGTGDSPLTIPFYEKCGFKKSHIKENFFADNYDHPIFECGVRLVDMIYLRKELRSNAI